MRIESTEKYPIYIVTEDSFGTAYCIKANKCSDILDDMHSNREQVPRDNAKVFFAAYDGEPINPNKYTDFKSCVEYISRFMTFVPATHDSEYIWEVVGDGMFENSVFASCSTEEKAKEAVEFLKESLGITSIKILPRVLDKIVTKSGIMYFR